MPKSTLANPPKHGYTNPEYENSAMAVKYLEYMSKTEHGILHAGNSREVVVAGSRVDGFVPEENKVISILGCFYHG